jgi:hypothetical protein
MERGDLKAVGLGLPAVGGDEVPVVLHGLRPVVHQVLVDVVFVDERLASVMRQQILGKGGADFLRVKASLQSLERGGALLPPGGKQGVHALGECRTLLCYYLPGTSITDARRHRVIEHKKSATPSRPHGTSLDAAG